MSDAELEGELEHTPDRSGKSTVKKVKVEGAPSTAWVDPLYAAQPTITWDRVTALKRDYFAQNYGLCNTGLAPKRLKFGVHVNEAEVEELFGAKVNANGYRYSLSEDTTLVEKVERIWMITHQRTSVPNTRQINVAEAKGLAYEIKRGKETNWCLHGEWTCREQLRRANLERGAAKQAAKGGGSSKEVDTLDYSETVLEEGDPTPSDCGQRSGSRLGLGKKLSDQQSMSIGEWQEHLSVLDREAPKLADLVKRRCEEKDLAKMELVKVSTQGEYGRSLVAAAELRLKILESEYYAADAEVLASKALEPRNATDIAVAEQQSEDARRKVEAQTGVLEQMRLLFGTGEAGYEEAKLKSELAEDAYNKACSKQELWGRHRVVLSAQLRAMMADYQRPTCFPAPSPSLYLDCGQICMKTVVVQIDPCPWCTRGFDPAWDCQFASCQHAYHSWCAYSHFSSSTKCIFKGCNQEMHEDWWAMTGIKKPITDTNKGAMHESWHICKSQNLGTDLRDPSRTSRSYSTVGVCAARSNTVSPSVGSFQTLGSTMPVADSVTVKVPQNVDNVVLEEKVKRLEANNAMSPKRKKHLHKNVARQSSEQGGAEQSTSLGFSDVGAWISTVVHGSGFDPNVQFPVGEGEGMQAEENIIRPEKRRKGTQRKQAMETVQEDLWMRKSQDDLCPESDDDGDLNNSASGETGKQQDDNGENEDDEAHNEVEPEVPPKLGRKLKNKKAKTPVGERVSVSRKTRAGQSKAAQSR